MRVECARANTYLVQGAGDGVAGGLADRGVVGGSEASEESSDGEFGEHGCFW